LWGVGPQTSKVLQRRGLHTVGDIADTPERTLISALGESLGHHLHELSWGRDPRPVVAERKEKSIGREITFDEDISTLETLRRTLLAQSERVSSQLRESGVECRTVALKVTFSDRIGVSRSRTLELPSAVSRDMYDTACALLDTLLAEQDIDLRRRPVRLIGVRGEQLVPAGAGDTPLWGESNETWREIDKTQDAVAAKFGRGTLKPASLLQGPGQRGIDESAHGAARAE
jgi:DNA polymerase-4